MFLKRFILSTAWICLLQVSMYAQMNAGGFNRMSGIGSNIGTGMSGTKKGNDSFQRRDINADSITIFYKLYGKNDIKKLDTSVNDFFVHVPVPYTSYYLGNLGNASKSYLFTPITNAGWDVGFHAYDTYNYTLEGTPIYQTTRPYTELGYLLGGKGEQLIEIKHTQNKKQQLNFSFEYRFSNAPGNLKNQFANFNNMRVTAHFQSKRKRYQSYLVMLTNKVASSENGGLVNAALLDSLALNNPYELETRLGTSGASFRNPFNTTVSTGSIYQNNTYLWKQSYDLGQKDSIVKDTVTTYMFYPRLRFQNEVKLQSNQFLFQDAFPDVTKYQTYFDYNGIIGANLAFKDGWKAITNEFSLISYPQKNNSNQYLQLGIGYQNLTAQFISTPSWSTNDIYGFGAYKNKTRNQLWDLDMIGKLFLSGFHAGDYDASVSLSRILSQKGNYIQVGFRNTNRTPSSNFLGTTEFPIVSIDGIKKENIIQINGALGNERAQWKTSVTYQLINNYHYFSTGYHAAVYVTPISYLRAQIQNKIKLAKYWNWYNELHVQLVDQASPIHVPLFLTRQRIAFEGIFYKNLNISTGLEFIYHTEFKADAYMPLTGQFYTQDSYTLQNRPTANAFVHFMIKRLKAYVRVENLNTLLPTSSSFGNHYNFMSKNYPGTGTWVHVGFWWNFIN